MPVDYRIVRIKKIAELNKEKLKIENMLINGPFKFVVITEMVEYLLQLEKEIEIQKAYLAIES
jgi:hypothetical protein